MALKVEYMTLSSSDATNKYVLLSGIPTDGTVALDLIGGTAQAITSDFAVDGTKVKWDSPIYNLYPVDATTGLHENDELRIIYDRS